MFGNYVKLLEEELPPGSPAGLKHEMGLDLITSLLFAGHDTTAATMVFAVKYIGENPNVLAELRVCLYNSNIVGLASTPMWKELPRLCFGI